jgi:hypothetical protein
MMASDGPQPISAIARGVYGAAEALAISNYVGRLPRKNLWLEIYILLWTALLVLMWAVNPGHATVGHVISLAHLFAVLAVYRWCEIFATILGFALPGIASFRPPRLLVVAAVYGLQITLVFAILDHAFAPGGWSATSHAFDYLYVSWTDMTTLGAKAGTTSAAHALTMATVTSGVLLLAILVARAVNDLGAVEHDVSHAQIDSRLSTIEQKLEDRLGAREKKLDGLLEKK